MDIVYPYRPSPEDFELRMSLRSLKHLKTPFENVWVIGEIPAWFRGKIIYQQDRMTGKQQNVIFKLLKICDDKRISEDFIVMNDDFIFTKDQELKNYQLGSLEGFELTKRGNYKCAILNTIEHLKGQNPLNFEVHYPIIFNKTKLRQSLKNIKWGSKPYVYRSVYMNEHKIPHTYLEEDFKAYSSNKDKFAGFLKQVERGFVSLDDRIAQLKEVRQHLNNLFPSRSKFD